MPARVTAPASGLFLERVFYAGDDRRLPLVPAFPVAGDVLRVRRAGHEWPGPALRRARYATAARSGVGACGAGIPAVSTAARRRFT